MADCLKLMSLGMVVKECKIEGRCNMENKNLSEYKTPKVRTYTDKESLDELGLVPTGFGREYAF